MIKVVEVTDSSKQKTFRGHDAPVLSLSFDPKDVYLVKKKNTKKLFLFAFCFESHFPWGEKN